MVADPSSDWSIDLGATKHIARDQVGFMKYRRTPSGNNLLFMENSDSVDVLSMGTYKLDLRGRRALLIHDVFYAPNVR